MNRDLHDQLDNLRHRLSIYEKALEAIADGFLIVGRNGRIVEINQAYCDFFGISREETIGKDIFSVIPNTRMIEIMDKNIAEVDALHKFIDGQSPTGDRMVAVSRMPVTVNGETIASVAIVKFSSYTITLANSLRKAEDEAAYYRKQLQLHGVNSFTFDDLSTTNPRYEKAKKVAQRFACSDVPILLLGETGVGKDVFAHAIHQASGRKNEPFVCVNCASIPSDLLESELFGYVDGAFTGSRKGGKKGKFELASGGTLLLDEIGDMPPFMQSKLLRVLQNQEVEKLGSEDNIRIDVRILAATNQNLLQKIEEGTFRLDLYYRLNVLPVVIPSLRERQEDIPSLVNRFIEELNDRYDREVMISAETLMALMQYNWPGNIRELRNVLARGFMLADEEDVIQPHHLPSSITGKRTSLPLPSVEKEKKAVDTPNASLPASGNTAEPTVKKINEHNAIIEALTLSKGNLSKAAQILGIHRSTLYSKIETFQILISDFKKKKTVD